MRFHLTISRPAPVALLVVFFLVLHLRRSSKPARSRLLQQAVSSQIQHGVPIRIDEEHTFNRGSNLAEVGQSQPANPHIKTLLECPVDVTIPVQHIRLPYHHQNISFVAPGQENLPQFRLFNPTLLPLPSWSTSGTYLIVSRAVTEGLHQESLICFADFCLPSNSSTRSSPGAQPCSPEDQRLLGPFGGLRCTTAPIKLNIPPTPALKCEGSWSAFPDIPGFHDPRIFWSNKGEPLIILNSASQYGCVGLWITDLRTLYPELEKMVNRHGKHSGPIMSYHHLTEVTRNPRPSRASVEKNWMLWFPGNDGEAYVQYDLGPKTTPQILHPSQSLNQSMLNDTSDRSMTVAGRTYAKLVGNGFTTPNLTSPQETSCFDETHNYDTLGKLGHWHQGSNALKLILCTRAQVRAGDCGDSAEWNADGREVHFAVMHRKFSNEMDLPMRYERYIAVWEGRKPFQMLGVSKSPILMESEWARPWTEEENWPAGSNRKGNWTAGLRRRLDGDGKKAVRSNAYFTYTPSLAWAWRPRTDHLGTTHGGEENEEDIHHLSQLGTGYLGEDVLVGIGLDDVDQAFAKVKVDELVACLRLCPGVTL